MQFIALEEKNWFTVATLCDSATTCFLLMWNLWITSLWTVWHCISGESGNNNIVRTFIIHPNSQQNTHCNSSPISNSQNTHLSSRISQPPHQNIFSQQRSPTNTPKTCTSITPTPTCLHPILTNRNHHYPESDRIEIGQILPYQFNGCIVDLRSKHRHVFPLCRKT